jgi:hypothetical protein
MGEKLITIKGIIPVDWDEKGKVVTAAISTHTENEYPIHKSYKGKELLDLLPLFLRGEYAQGNMNLYLGSLSPYINSEKVLIPKKRGEYYSLTSSSFKSIYIRK